MSRTLLTKAPPRMMGAPDENSANPVVVSRESANQYLVLNSADRWLTGALASLSAYRTQPWNRFQLQRPQALMEAFARRVRVCEVKFPWAVPNVNQYTNTMWFCNGNDYLIDKYVELNLPNGFYTPNEMVNTLNPLLQTAYTGAGYLATDAPVLSYDSSDQGFTFSPGTSGASFALFSFNPVGVNTPEFLQKALESYLVKPSLLKSILGFGAGALSLPPSASPISGFTTFMEYTQYIDIISEKLNYYADIRDGSSGVANTNALVCRLYIADEISLTSDVPKACRPFMIHRQFKNEKCVKWSPEAVIDYLDIQVIDQWGNLIPLPGNNENEAYPDFQITMLASEN